MLLYWYCCVLDRSVEGPFIAPKPQIVIGDKLGKPLSVGAQTSNSAAISGI
jgi:hypothetical protein